MPARQRSVATPAQRRPSGAAATGPAAAPQNARDATAGTPVIAHRPCRPGTAVPMFGDDVWSLACIEHQPNRSPSSLHFEAGLPPAWRRAAKELAWQRLNVPVANMRRLGMAGLASGLTSEKILSAFKLFVRFLGEAGVQHLHEVEEAHVREFVASVVGGRSGTQHKAATLKIVDMLWESRDHFTGGGLPFPPFAGRSSSQLVGHRRSEENTTDRVPEPILGGLLSWALAYVDHFSADILAAERSYRGVGASGLERTGHEAETAFERYVAEEVAGEGGLPATVIRGEVKVARELVAKRAGVKTSWFTFSGLAALERAREEHGLKVGCLGEPSCVPEGADAAWREAMGVEDMKAECRHLVVACYVVCAYLSGMRDAEVQTLRRGCLGSDRDGDGRPYRHRLRGLVFKERDEPEEATWVVIDPVARAISVLHELTADFHGRTGDPYLFVRLHFETKANALVKGRMNQRLRDFAAHCCALSERLPGGRGKVGRYDLARIPDGPSGPWRFVTSQFRRTIAWHIANTPFGVIAGMIQYKHASLKMFEGYAGSSASGFRAEVELEEALARERDVVAMYDEARGGDLPAGPMARELRAVFDFVASVAGDFPGQVLDDDRVAQLLRQKARQMHVGVLADCFYVPGKARCQSTTPTPERIRPVLAVCDHHCANACWRGKHLDSWRDLEKRTLSLLGANRISPLQRGELRSSLADIRKTIAAIGGE